MNLPTTGSIPPLASLFGSLLAGPCLTYLGRRRTLMLISIPYSVGFLLIGFASHVSMLYIGRILDGCMIGFTAPSAQIFVSINDLFQMEIPFPFCCNFFFTDWWVRITSSTWSPWSFHCHLSLIGYFDHLRHWRFRSMERIGMDFECFSSSTFRCHVFHARNANLAPVQ